MCGALVGTLSNKKEFPTTTSSGVVADHREAQALVGDELAHDKVYATSMTPPARAAVGRITRLSSRYPVLHTLPPSRIRSETRVRLLFDDPVVLLRASVPPTPGGPTLDR